MEGVEDGETVSRIYCMKKKPSISNKRKKIQKRNALMLTVLRCPLAFFWTLICLFKGKNGTFLYAYETEKIK